jgi:flagellar protein FlbD
MTLPKSEPGMIKLTRLNHIPLIVNSDLIDHIEMTPDTIITLTSGQKFMVLETAEDVVEKVIEFRRSIMGKGFFCPAFSRPAVDETTGTGSQDPPVHGR